MRLSPIRVECYAGHKADETPRAIHLQGRRLEVRGITDRWYQGDRNPEWPIADYFRVVTADGGEYMIMHDRESDQWYLVDRAGDSV